MRVGESGVGLRERDGAVVRLVVERPRGGRAARPGGPGARVDGREGGDGAGPPKATGRRASRRAGGSPGRRSRRRARPRWGSGRSTARRRGPAGRRRSPTRRPRRAARPRASARRSGRGSGCARGTGKCWRRSCAGEVAREHRRRLPGRGPRDDGGDAREHLGPLERQEHGHARMVPRTGSRGAPPRRRRARLPSRCLDDVSVARRRCARTLSQSPSLGVCPTGACCCGSRRWPC
jgi:hypothetical protein